MFQNKYLYPKAMSYSVFDSFRDCISGLFFLILKSVCVYYEPGA